MAQQVSNIRPSWDEYFLMLAKLASTRSTCLAYPVGAVIVRDRQVLATGYNGTVSGMPHCTDRGYCYPSLETCTVSKELPSRAVHAEANAIAQAAKHGIPTNGATIYVTLEPCFNCLKLIVSAGITEVYYGQESPIRDVVKKELIEGLSVFEQVRVRDVVANNAAWDISRMGNMATTEE